MLRRCSYIYLHDWVIFVGMYVGKHFVDSHCPRFAEGMVVHHQSESLLLATPLLFENCSTTFVSLRP